MMRCPHCSKEYDQKDANVGWSKSELDIIYGPAITPEQEILAERLLARIRADIARSRAEEEAAAVAA